MPKASGLDGVLITDLSVEEAERPTKVLRQASLDSVFLAAPTSTSERIQKIARFSSGFVYAVSRTGVTGEQKSISEEVRPLGSADPPAFCFAGGGRLWHFPSWSSRRNLPPGRRRCRGKLDCSLH